MGLRFRKSVNFGPFRVNLSKSGIGYSVGGKGARITKRQRAASGLRRPYRVRAFLIQPISAAKRAIAKETAAKSKRLCLILPISRIVQRKSFLWVKLLSPSFLS